jgi:hypothetical protein
MEQVYKMTLNCCSFCFNQSPLVRLSPWDHCGSSKLVNRQENILKSIGTNEQRVVVVTTRLLLQTKKGNCPLDHSGSGSGHATTQAQAMLLLAIYELKYVL